MRAILPDELTLIAPAGAARRQRADAAAAEEAAARRAETAAAVAEAVAAERARAAAEAEAAALAAEVARAAAVEAARADWAAGEGAGLAAALADGLAALEARLADALGRAVAPVVGDLWHARGLEAFRATLEGLLADPETPPFAIRGPADLLAGLSAALPDLDSRATLSVGDGPDLSLVLGPTRIETRFAAFAETLSRLGGAP